MMIGRYRLARAGGALGGDAVPENREARLSVSRVPVTGSFHVAKHLIVSAIFLDDVDDVLDRASTSKEFGRCEIHKAVVLHGLLGVAGEGRTVGKQNGTHVAGHDRTAVLAALPIFSGIRRKCGVRWIRRAAAVVHAH